MEKVYTFFEEIPGIKPDTELLDYWRQSWAKFGWQPIRLSIDDAEAAGPAVVNKILASPELGRGALPEGYAYATHLRWVAFAQLGGLIVDYDVINNGFTPALMEKEQAKHDPELPIFLNACPCCCAVYASPSAASKMLARILQHAEESEEAAGMFSAERLDPKTLWSGELKDVCHDQAIFERFEKDWAYPEFSYVKEFSTDGWHNAPLIHFCNKFTKSPRGRVVRMCGLRSLR